MKLREGVTFRDGSTFYADDVEFRSIACSVLKTRNSFRPAAAALTSPLDQGRLELGSPGRA